MYIRCACCGREMNVPPICTSEAWPAGWQIALNRDGEHWLCSHACAAAWHQVQAIGDLAGPVGRQAWPVAGAATPTGIPRPLRGRPC